MGSNPTRGSYCKVTALSVLCCFALLFGFFLSSFLLNLSLCTCTYMDIIDAVVVCVLVLTVVVSAPAAVGASEWEGGVSLETQLPVSHGVSCVHGHPALLPSRLHAPQV